MLEDILKDNKCFKLVCGAGNEYAAEVEKLVYLYSKAGCNIFDVSANADVIRAAKRGLEKAGILENRYICVSVGIKGDPHINKAFINPEKCRRCLKCFSVCPQSAIKSCIVDERRCIGCQKCFRVCAYDAVGIQNKSKDIENLLPIIIDEDVDLIELHAISSDENDFEENLKIINNRFKGLISICLDRSKLSNEQFISRIKRAKEIIQDRPFIIQADGAPMSGGEDDYNSTLQAVAAAELIQKSKLDVYVLISGGTNSKSKKLEDLCGVNINGVAIGSYARKIVKDYLCDKMEISYALKIAEDLVKSIY